MNEDRVLMQEDACPECGEDRIDWLVWNNSADDDETVTCQSCQTVYVPPTHGRKPNNRIAPAATPTGAGSTG